MTSTPPLIRARSHEGTLAAIPYLMGFHPENSLVFLFAADRRVVLTARIDLTPKKPDVTAHDIDDFHGDDLGTQATEPAHLLDDLEGVNRYLNHLVSVSGADQVSLVAYGDDPDTGLRIVKAVADVSPIPVADRIHATTTHFWAACCSSDPEPEPYEVESHEVAAQAVMAGVTALPGRAAVVDLAAGPDPEDPACRAAQRAAARQLKAIRRRRRLPLAEAIVQRHLSDPGMMDATTCALLAQLVDDIQCRDAVWLLMDRPTAEQHVALWSRVVAHTLPQWEVPPLCLLGVAAWIAGNGALLVECASRVRSADPDYSLGRILDDIQARALPPTFWDELRRDLQDDCGEDAKRAS